MHTLDELDAADFRYGIDGGSVGRDEVMPAISTATRVGVVMGDGVDGLGAGNFVLACVIAFYDALRERTADFFEYPDFYTVQATDDPADYRMLDIYPDHKNVRTDADAEAVLRTVNDRAIDVLLVPDGAASAPEVEDITRRSAERRIASCYRYSPRGRLEDEGFVIGVPRDPVEEWYDATARTTSSDGSGGWRSGEEPHHRLSQGFRRIPLARALEHLPHHDDRD